jgi:hypothetical protein
VTIESEYHGHFVPTECIMVHIQCAHVAPFEILWNNVQLPQILDEDRFRTADKGWHYDHSTKSCSVKYGNGRDLEKMVVSFGKFDLIRMDPDE